MARKPGRARYLAYSSSLIGATPSWQELTLGRDVTVNRRAEEADVAGNEVHTVYVQGPKDISIDAVVVLDVGDTDYDALKAAYDAGTPLGWQVLNEPGTGGEGDEFDGIIVDFTATMERASGQLVRMRVVPTPSDTPPQPATGS